MNTKVGSKVTNVGGDPHLDELSAPPLGPGDLAPSRPTVHDDAFLDRHNASSSLEDAERLLHAACESSLRGRLIGHNHEVVSQGPGNDLLLAHRIGPANGKIGQHHHRERAALRYAPAPLVPRSYMAWYLDVDLHALQERTVGRKKPGADASSFQQLIEDLPIK
eukprot:5187837-Alexandrium_andersonii.AAC.1